MGSKVVSSGLDHILRLQRDQGTVRMSYEGGNRKSVGQGVGVAISERIDLGVSLPLLSSPSKVGVVAEVSLGGQMIIGSSNQSSIVWNCSSIGVVNKGVSFSLLSSSSSMSSKMVSSGLDHILRLQRDQGTIGVSYEGGNRDSIWQVVGVAISERKVLGVSLPLLSSPSKVGVVAKVSLGGQVVI